MRDQVYSGYIFQQGDDGKRVLYENVLLYLCKSNDPNISNRLVLSFDGFGTGRTFKINSGSQFFGYRVKEKYAFMVKEELPVEGFEINIHTHELTPLNGSEWELELGNYFTVAKSKDGKETSAGHADVEEHDEVSLLFANGLKQLGDKKGVTIFVY